LLYDKKQQVIKFIFRNIPLEILAESFLGFSEETIDKVITKLSRQNKKIFWLSFDKFKDKKTDKQDKKKAIKYVIKNLSDFFEKDKMFFVSSDLSLREELHKMMEE
jgi:hypothetical protein